MTRTEELLALAEAAWEKGRATELHLGHTGDSAGCYVAYISNKDLKQLVELVRLQHEALDAEAKYARRRGDDVVAWVDQALEAFNKWEGK